jgi:hypothetical protein
MHHGAGGGVVLIVGSVEDLRCDHQEPERASSRVQEAMGVVIDTAEGREPA